MEVRLAVLLPMLTFWSAVVHLLLLLLILILLIGVLPALLYSDIVGQFVPH